VRAMKHICVARGSRGGHSSKASLLYLPVHACAVLRVRRPACAGQPGEQWTMFFTDDSDNALEFKAMTNPENLFAKYHVDC